ncbi:MAG: hypothetical protein ACOYNL_03290 [Rickettsiales bacterium]
MNGIIESFRQGLSRMNPKRQYIRKEKRMRNEMHERQIDMMICDSFPASDPPSTY